MSQFNLIFSLVERINDAFLYVTNYNDAPF